MEGRSVADRRDECGGRDWSDARDGHQPSRILFAKTKPANVDHLDLRIDEADALISWRN
jgi:hypothetical protein